MATLTVNPGAPVVNNDTSPSGNVYAYVNGSLTFTANFNGSQPMTYQWRDQQLLSTLPEPPTPR